MEYLKDACGLSHKLSRSASAAVHMGQVFLTLRLLTELKTTELRNRDGLKIYTSQNKELNYNTLQNQRLIDALNESSEWMTQEFSGI